MTVNLLRYAAFTDDPAGGNLAGVVLDADGLTHAEMLATAAEVGYSETIFLSQTETERHYNVRYFSPLDEVDFCGHASVAAAAALAERDGAGPVLFKTNVGDIPVDTELVGSLAKATLTSAATRSRPATADEIREALSALRWTEADLHPDFPVHVAFGGNEHLIVPAVRRGRLAELDYDFDALGELCKRRNWTTVHIFWAEDATRFHARNPFPLGGVVEDPATGAAAAAFGGYLRAIGRVTSGSIVIHQGVDMGRPSELHVEISPEVPGVRITGQAIHIT